MEPNITQGGDNQSVQPTPPTMPKQNKQISSWVGFLVIVIFALIVFGGVFAWQYFATQNNNVIVKNEIVGPKKNLSELNKDVLLHKLFPALTFNNGIANLQREGLYADLKLYLKNSTEDYFVNNQEKDLLLTVQLDGMPHAGGLYHTYLGLFDNNGTLLTPSSAFGSGDINIGQGGAAYDFWNDKAQFSGDGGQFGFYDCNGIKYILFVSRGCPNSSCCSDDANLFKVNNGVFENVQSVNKDYSPKAGGPYYGLKMSLSVNNIIINKVPFESTNGCPETNYKELNWDNSSCIFK